MVATIGFENATQKGCLFSGKRIIRKRKRSAGGLAGMKGTDFEPRSGSSASAHFTVLRETTFFLGEDIPKRKFVEKKK